ncbi:MAG TPA: TAXI family TRAP transporter solute-binding subunit [Alphaproteobacteria bacterium]|jgi:TRAP transporter TAXI family solute receptor|nr:TAXI family TRAP transporter solute-binding subunit [Alphaproteobacteria bacterium]
MLAKPSRIRCVYALAGAFALALGAGQALADPVAISTLPPGAINNVQASVIAKVIQEKSDLQMRVATFNAPSAILGSVQNRQAEFAFTSNDEAGVAFRGQDEYKGHAMKDLRVALTVFPFAVGVMVQKDSPIKKVADLKGKKFATGWQGFKQGIPLTDGVLATAGLSLKDVDPVPATNLLRAADDFKAGKTVGAMFAIGAPKVAEIDAAIGGVRFLSLDNSPEALARMQKVRPEYHIALRQPSPVLPGVIGPTYLMEYYIVVMTGAQVPDDVVYKAVKTLAANKAELIKGHPSYNAFDPANMAVPHPGMTYHPGAIKFYKEAGVWKGN